MRADDVRLHERIGAGDRAVDVRLGSEVHDRVELFLAQQGSPASAVWRMSPRTKRSSGRLRTGSRSQRHCLRT